MLPSGTTTANPCACSEELSSVKRPPLGHSGRLTIKTRQRSSADWWSAKRHKHSICCTYCTQWQHNCPLCKAVTVIIIVQTCLHVSVQVAVNILSLDTLQIFHFYCLISFNGINKGLFYSIPFYSILLHSIRTSVEASGAAGRSPQPEERSGGGGVGVRAPAQRRQTQLTSQITKCDTVSHLFPTVQCKVWVQ